MKKQIVLSQEDIRQELANSFNVDKDKVELDWKIGTKDDGSFPRTVVTWIATVEVPMNDQR